MSYTTVTNVRREAGMVGNTNIADSVFSGKIDLADALIDSYLANVYSMPLSKYYKQTIVFSGTGNAAANMTITIDSANYVIAVTNGKTASQAADLFRTAAGVSTNTSFVTDGLGAGATVTIYSIASGDSTDVTITSADPQTVAGITATGGTVTETTVPLLESLSTQIAAAYMLIEEYGPEAEDSDKDGEKKLRFLITEVLEKIESKQLRVLNFAKTELTLSTLKSPSFVPNDSTSDDDAEDPTTPKFTMNKVF